MVYSSIFVTCKAPAGLIVPIIFQDLKVDGQANVCMNVCMSTLLLCVSTSLYSARKLSVKDMVGEV